MKVSLYNIQNEYLQIVESLIENGGELTPELETEIKINKDQLQTKGVCYGFIIKDLEAENKAIDFEIERLNNFKKSRTNAIDRLKTNLSTAMQVFEIEQLETPLIKINFRKSESIEIEDLSLLNDAYKVTKTTVTADKVKIKNTIKDGGTVVGATISYNKNIQIK